jgi:hypothetical protein
MSVLMDSGKGIMMCKLEQGIFCLEWGEIEHDFMGAGLRRKTAAGFLLPAGVIGVLDLANAGQEEARWF